MKKIIYFIPGLGENCSEARYKKLAEEFKAQGYIVHGINPNWYQPLSEQIFRVEKNAIICGFSFGAVIAYLVAKKYPCRKVILASLSPLHLFSFKSLVKDYSGHMSEKLSIKISRDIKNIKISLNSLDTPYVTVAGELEKKIPGQVLVPKTGHRINKNYIQVLKNLI